MYKQYANKLCLILWSFEQRVLLHAKSYSDYSRQHARSCRRLNLFLYQVNVINCLFNVQMSWVYSKQLNFAILTIFCAQQNAWMPTAYYTMLLWNPCAWRRAVIRRILQPGAWSAFIIHVCMSSHMPGLQDMWHTGHSCMCMHHLCTEINHIFQWFIDLNWKTDLLQHGAVEYVMCSQMVLSNELFLTVT